MRACLPALLLAVAMPLAAQDVADASAPPLSSRVDYTRPGARDLPIRCKPADVEYFAGKTMGEVFGSAWPQVPDNARIDPPQILKTAPPTWPRGLGGDHAVAVVAILIGPDGRALDAHAVCASMPAIAKPAVRAALRSVYQAARFDGLAGTSVAVRPFVFGVRERPSSPVPQRPGRPGRP